MKKILAILLALAMILGVAATVQAEPPTFSISITSVTGGPGSDSANNTYTNPISLSGNASATHFPGHVSQYQVQIDWGDGIVDTDSNVSFTISESGIDFAGTWSSDPSHVYANGTYIINAKLYHQQPPGNEAGDAQAAPILIVVVNTPPVAVDDSATTDEDTPVIIDVLANDSDIDADALTVASVTQGSNGSVANNGANVTYSPNANWYGIDSFIYTISDGNGGTDTATVTVTVSAVNDNPVAVDDNATTDEDTPVIIDVLANDSDVDADALTVASVTQGSNGSVANNGADVTYSPNANWYGNDTFTYTISDGNGGTDTATVTVTVNAVNDNPVAVDDGATTDEDTPVTIDVLANDSDIDADPLTVAAVTQGSNGSVANNSANVTYSPNANWYGNDTFTYTASDGNGGTDTATVTVTVNAVNDNPVAIDDAYSLDEDTTLNVPVPGVLGNDNDVDLDALTAILVGNVTNGNLTLNSNGSFIYTPNADFNGVDSFTYRASDGVAESNVANVTITVNPVTNGGGGGGISIGRRYLTVDFEGEITRGLLTYGGRLAVDLAAPSPDEMHWLELDKGTKTLDSEGKIVTLIEIREVEAPPSPDNTMLVGNAYDFGPANITFDQPVRLTLSYNVTELSEDTLAVVMSYYEPEGIWTEMNTESSQLAEIGSLTGITQHFTVFALFAELPNFQVTDLSIAPSKREIWSFPTFVVRTGEEALISINIANNANREATYTAIVQVDGEARATRDVTLASGESRLVVFTISDNELGRYTIVVDSLSGELTSSMWINWWLIGIIAAALILIIFFSVWSYRRRGKTAE